MGARSLILGLDGADVSVIEELGPTRLPNLHAHMKMGAWARLESVRPPATLPNWTTFLTGMDPGRHGVFDFTTRDGYGVRFTAGTVRETPTWIARLDALGKRCACVGFPGTWPPEPLEHGIFLSGWDAPVAFEADRSFVWPEALFDRIVDRFGPMDFDVGEFDADADGWHDGLADLLVAKIERKVELAQWLLDPASSGPGGDRAAAEWDVFAFYFGESDTVAHHLWAHHDSGSPRHPSGASAKSRTGLGRVYEALDRAVGALVQAAGPGVELTLVSDHGSGGSSDKVLYLNRALEAAGLLKSAPRSVLPWSRLAKDAALTLLPPRLKERLFRAYGARLPSWLESRARFPASGSTYRAATRSGSCRKKNARPSRAG
jgi:predicted AlkP superfamily phosphohydrolase/phosphomutase